MQEYFTDFDSKKKYPFKMFDLEKNKLNKESLGTELNSHFEIFENEQNDCIEKCQNDIYLWNDGEYKPDFNINILVNDQIKLSKSVLNKFKDGFSRIVSSSWALTMTSKMIYLI